MSSEADPTAGDEHDHEWTRCHECRVSGPCACSGRACAGCPAEPDAGDVEALAAEVCVCTGNHNPNTRIECRYALDAATKALASDWLAADRAATAERTLAVVAIHRLHASMNICTGCDWRATPNAGSLTDQHWAHVTDRVARIARGEGR